VVLKSIPILDDAGLTAVRQWTFEPGTLDGQPVDVIYNLVVNFSVAPSAPEPR
jgi:outer membrane biosynthesis protein TonB